MFKIIISILFVGISFLLQANILQAVSFGGIVPNLMIITTASYGFMRGKKSGILIGFFSGLCMDIFFSDVLGYYALIYMYIGYLNGNFRKIFYPEDIKLPIFLILGSDLIYNLLCYISSFLLRGRFQFIYYVIHIIMPEMIYTIVITCIFYPLLRWVENRLESRDKEGVSNIVS